MVPISESNGVRSRHGGDTPRRRLSKDARRAEILNAGEQVFSQKPFDEVSIDDIAAAAHSSKNLLYHYFAGKRELFIAVIAEGADRMLAATAPDMSLEPMERLHASIDAHLRHAEEHAAGYVKLMRSGGVDEEVEAIVSAARQRAVERALAGLELPGEPPAELALAVAGWVGMIDSLTVAWLESSTIPRERVRELLAELFVAVLTTAGSYAARP